MRHITLVMVGQQDVFSTAGFRPVSSKCTWPRLCVHLYFSGLSVDCPSQSSWMKHLFSKPEFCRVLQLQAASVSLSSLVKYNLEVIMRLSSLQGATSLNSRNLIDVDCIVLMLQLYVRNTYTIYSLYTSTSTSYTFGTAARNG